MTDNGPANKQRSPEDSAVVALTDGKARLIRIAMKLFAEKGFDGVTVRDISAAAEVSLGLINHHFGSKEGLREAVDKYVMSQFEDVFAEGFFVPALDPSRGVSLLSEQVEHWISRHFDDWNLLKGYMRRALLEDSEWGHNLFGRFYRFARNVIDQMDAQGKIRPDVDRLWLPLLMMYMELGTMVFEPYVERVLGRSGFDRALWRRRHRAYIDLMYNGVLPEEDQDAEGKPL